MERTNAGLTVKGLAVLIEPERSDAHRRIIVASEVIQNHRPKWALKRIGQVGR
jgi:hypothetical protein